MEQEIEMVDEGLYQSGENNIVYLNNVSMTGSMIMALNSESGSPLSKIKNQR